MPKLYTWEQTPTEVRISVPLTEDFNFKRDVSYTIKNGRQMTLKVGGREIINGTLAGIVDQDMAEFGCNVHEEGGVRGLEVHLEKANSVPWRACFEGEEPDAPAPAAAAPAAKPVASPAPAPAKAPTPAAAAAPAPAPAKKQAGVTFTEAATKPPPPSTRPPAAAVAAAAAEAEGGSSTCMMCMAAGAVLGVVGYAVDHWQKNSL